MPAKPITVRNRDILKVIDGLRGLDGVASSKTEITRFEFESKLAWDIAKGSDIFERAGELITKQRKKNGAKFGVVENMKVTEANAQSVASYMEADEALLDQTQELNGVLLLSRTELQKGNAIPPSVLRCLIPVLVE